MYLISFITNAPFMLQFISWLPSQLACSSHFKLLYFFGVLLQAEVTQRLSYGRETSEGNVKMHSHEDLAKKLQVIWDCIIAAISLLPFLFCIFLTLTWSLGAVGFSSYFKVLYKLPCATLYRCFSYNCMVDLQSFL